MSQPRKDIRSKILQQRSALSSREITEHSRHACASIANSEIWRSSHAIAFYIAQKGEINPNALLQLALQQGKTCYLPALAGSQHNELVMVRYHPDDTLTLNRYGIAEPEQNLKKIINPIQLDLVLVPLVAYDLSGSRLGMGLGYYDRTFAFLNHRKKPHHPLLIGLAYTFQHHDHLPRADWDVPLDWIATEISLIEVNKI